MTWHSLLDIIGEFERAAVETALAVCNGNVARAAKVLGCNRTTLIERMKKLELNRADFEDYLVADVPVDLPVKYIAPRTGSVLRQSMLTEFMETLKRLNGNRTDTAHALGISYRTVKYYIKECKELGHDIPDSPFQVCKKKRKLENG